MNKVVNFTGTKEQYNELVESGVISDNIERPTIYNVNKAITNYNK